MPVAVYSMPWPMYVTYAHTSLAVLLRLGAAKVRNRNRPAGTAQYSR